MEAQSYWLVCQHRIGNAKLTAHAFIGIRGLNIHNVRRLPLFLHSQLDVI